MFIIDIFKEIAVLFLEMAPYLMLGLFFVGLLHVFFSKEMVSRHIGKNNLASVVKASLLGVPLPLCSCGVVPTSVFMAKNGASKGSVVSFMISTPQTGIDSIIATYGMMGWVFAIFRPIAAFLMGLIGGTITRFFDTEPVPEKKAYIPLIGADSLVQGSAAAEDDCGCDDGSCGTSSKPEYGDGIVGKTKRMFNYSFVEFLDDISMQFIVGLGISGLIAYFIPDSFFESSALSSGILAMLIMILIGAPMYVCATASIPIAVTLMLKGFSPGVAFVFLAVGPATNAASFTIIANVLGKKISILYLLVISLSAILFGYLLDYIFYLTGIDPLSFIHSAHTHDMIFNDEIKLVLGIIFFILLLFSVYRKYISGRIRKKEKILEAKHINIEGMSCNHCVMNVKKAIEDVQGVEKANVVLADNAAYIEGDFKQEEVNKAVESIGYKVV